MNAHSSEQQAKPVGGIVFFLSLLVLCFLSVFNLTVLPGLFKWERVMFKNWLFFLVGVAVGTLLAHLFIRGTPAVFIHELKHMIISNLAGNKIAGLPIYQRKSGKFAYKYSPQTAPYNAFIALAPYILPLNTIAILLAALPFFFANHNWLCITVGFGYGTDMALNLRDISPLQSDITFIRGGYKVGLLYIIAMNITIFTIIAAWVCADVQGLAYLLQKLWTWGLSLAGISQAMSNI